ncbi:MAG: 23S rRNA (guanosine(2251)-2'-O)-methyltransferase RlmB [Lachnospiraceae bacterium]|nr:23S rRNA (guanosine(2251)-2'-O)-methyltransferase RlmB [Lachnospiraceae bacterium]
MRDESSIIAGRNSVLSALRSETEVEKVFIQEGLNDGPIQTIIKEAKKQNIIFQMVKKERLDQICGERKHQGVAAYTASFAYAEVSDILENAAKKNEAPFIIILDEIEDPHNLGAIIRTANICGAHGVIIPKHRAAGLTSSAFKAASGALSYTPVAKVTNIKNTIEDLKKEGLWFVCADMGGESMYDLNLTGPIGLVMGNEGSGVSPLIRKSCDMVAAIPMKGDIDSLNVSVATGVLSYEILRQRMNAGNR